MLLGHTLTEKMEDNQEFRDVVDALPESVRANGHCIDRLRGFDPERAAVTIITYFWRPIDNEMGNEISLPPERLLILMEKIYLAKGGQDVDGCRVRWRRLLAPLRYAPLHCE